MPPVAATVSRSWARTARDPDDALMSHIETCTDAERPWRAQTERGSSCPPPAHSRRCDRLTLPQGRRRGYGGQPNDRPLHG